MLATLQNRSMLFFLVIVTLTVLSACSRDNPLSIPEPFIEEGTYCLEGSPYTPKLLESISVSDLSTDLPVDYPNSYINKPLEEDLRNSYLIDKITIQPETISDIEPALEDGADSSDVIVIKTKQVDLELLLNLANIESKNRSDINGGVDPSSLQELIDGGVDLNLINQEIIDLFDYEPKINSMSITIINEEISQAIDDETAFLTSKLRIAENNFITKVSANVKVPRTSLDCKKPLTQKELNGEDFEAEDLYKSIVIEQEFPLTIIRKTIGELNNSELEKFISLSARDNFGKVLAITDDFLVVGLPDEDSLSNGIYDVGDFNGTPGFELNENSQDSGAVIIFKKDEMNNWQFHRFIKSSNTEAGDRFGSSVAMFENSLVVSSPGEDSISAGIHKTSDSDTQDLKMNNSALSSGAVYIYKYDEETDNWSETHYIKPNINVVSGGSYNKGFGTVVSIQKNKLLISAPLEDSNNGDENDSSQPDSGAVYSYSFSEDQNNWNFQETIKAINPGANDKFGSSLAMNENLIAIGSPFEDSDFQSIYNVASDQEFENIDVFDDNTQEDSGAVYVYSYAINSNLMPLIGLIKPSNNDPFDYFGITIALHNTNLLVGATGEDSSGKGLNRDMNKNDLSNSGATYLFTLNNNTNVWVESAYIKADDSQKDAAFGKYIAFNESNIFISSPLYSSDNNFRAGKVYSYRLEDAGLAQELQFQALGVEDDMRFGSSLALFKENLAIGASGLVVQESGNDEVFAGTIFTYE